MNRYTKVRELVKNPSLKVTEIAWKTGYNKGHVSRLRKEAMRQALEEKPGPTAWRCQCGKAYTVTCISNKPAKREWVGLTLNEAEEFYDKYTDRAELINAIDKFLEEKNA